MRFFKDHYRLICGIFLLALFVFWTGFINRSSVKVQGQNTKQNIQSTANRDDIPASEREISADADGTDPILSSSLNDDSVNVQNKEPSTDSVSQDITDSIQTGSDPSQDNFDNSYREIIPENLNSEDISDDSDPNESNLVEPMGPLVNYNPVDGDNSSETSDSQTDINTDLSQNADTVTETASVTDVKDNTATDTSAENNEPDSSSAENGSEESSENAADETADTETITNTAYTPSETPLDVRPEFNYCVANVSSSLNIRQGPSTGYPLAGKMHANAWAKVLEYGEEWSKISSGGIEGYAYNGYLLFGDDALKRVQSLEALYVQVFTNVLNVRTEPNTDSRIIKRLTDGDKYPYVPEYSSKEWFAIRIEDGSIAFVSTAYCSLYISLPTITIE